MGKQHCRVYQKPQGRKVPSVAYTESSWFPCWCCVSCWVPCKSFDLFGRGLEQGSQSAELEQIYCSDQEELPLRQWKILETLQGWTQDSYTI